MYLTKRGFRRLLLVGLMLPTLLQALTSDKDQPMTLEADSVSIDDSTGVSLYEGNVVITQGSLKLWADRVRVYRRDGKTVKIVSEGKPTHFEQLTDDQEKIRGHALRAEFYPEKDELMLFDDAVLEQGEDRFSSDRIRYNRGAAQVRAGTSAQGKQRVQVVIEPQKTKTP